jgi:cytochrome c553
MNYLTKSCLTVLSVLFLTTSAANAADAENGRKLARQCSVCHGKFGVSPGDPEVPNLVGQSSFYLEKSLKDYRSGAREDRRMTLLAKNLSDDDIKDRSAWFESIKITVIEPEL